MEEMVKKIEKLAKSEGVSVWEYLHDNEVYKINKEDHFNEMINDCYEEVKIGGFNYEPANVLYKVDPIAYNQELSSYFDNGVKDDEFITFDDCESFYHYSDIEDFLDSLED